MAVDCPATLMIRLRYLLSALALLLLSAMPAAAQTPAPAPLTQQQFDQLVDSLAKAVTERLKAEPAPAAGQPAGHLVAPAASPAPAAAMMSMTNEDPLSEKFIEVLDRSDDALAELPALIAQGSRLPQALSAELNNGRPPGRFLLLLAACVALVLGTEALLRLVLRPLRHHLAERVTGMSSLWALTALISLDIFIIAGLWLLTHGLIVGLFEGAVPQAHLGFLVLTSVFFWRLYLLAFRIALRPNLPQARLATVDDAEATAIYRWTSAVILVAIALAGIRRIVEGMHSPPLVVACSIMVGALVLTLVLIAAAVAVRRPVAKWLHGLTRGGRQAPMVATVARFWLVVAIPAFLILGMARLYGALTTANGVHDAILMTVHVLIGLLILESFMDRVTGLMRADDRPGSSARERAIEALLRCARVAILLGSLSLLFRIWAVSGIGMMDMSGYNRLAGAALPAGAILLGAYCAWQAVEYLTGLHAHSAGSAAPGHQDAEDAAAAAPTASRMSTLMPLLRVTLMLAIIVMATLTVLSQLGIDITPLIAGASIVGLAISFGSQTLVKDIVSGVFYLVDDAFRVGEYIDCGKAKGTVEGFTLRSLKLRHQNGMVHTIPFGQLGQITNFSRDWATLKFNLRFTRDTDLEKLRKTVKKIGLELQDDPEYKEDFLSPLKMQGVADVADSALIVRFKFTVKPTRPTVIQREAIKRMIRILPEQGIEFANATVAVQTIGHSGDPAAAAALNKVANDLAAAERAAAAEAAAAAG